MTILTALTPTRFGEIDTANRLVMAPMTRSRATPEGLATALMAEYYAQRASAGLIVTEGIQPSPTGKGFINTPGLHNPAQVASWRVVTDAVHARGGKIVAQLMHAGRIGHPELYADKHSPVAPSSVAAKGQAWTPEGLRDYPIPREMNARDISQAIQEHVNAAKNAIDAGFDGVEIHAGNGFLLHQFMANNTNQRSDEYGHSIAGHNRFPLEVINACADAIGHGRIGIRLSPGNSYNDIDEGDTASLYQALLSRLPHNLAYLHIMESNNRHQTNAIRAIWKGPLILNPHADATCWPASVDVIDDLLHSGLADGVCFGALFLANPDLVERIRLGADFNAVDESTFYGGDATGYTDYPTLQIK